MAYINAKDDSEQVISVHSKAHWQRRESELTHWVRRTKRKRRAKQTVMPVLNAYHGWLKEQRSRTLPKSLAGQALAYSLNQWDKLTAFLADGRLELDNNRSERSIKPFVIGRKN